MEVRGYFQQIRSVEATLPAGGVIGVSLATPDGGREGRFMELTAAMAAKMIVDKKIRLASDDEATRFRSTEKAAAEEAAAREIQPQAAFLVDLASEKRESAKAKKR